MSTRHEQLRDLNGTGEDQKEDCGQNRLAIVAQAKCQSGDGINERNARSCGVCQFQDVDREEAPIRRR